jgi:hypothetical protein
VEVAVRSVQPVLAGWAEDVHVKRVLQRLGFVGHVRGDVEDLSGAYHQLLPVRGVLGADPEAQGAVEDVGKLLVLMGVGGDDGAFVEVDMGEHHAFAGEEPAGDGVRDLLFGHVVPAGVAYGRAHVAGRSG